MYKAVPPKMLISGFLRHRWTMAVKAAAANAGIKSLMAVFTGPVRELKASTVMATGGTVFSTKERKTAVRVSLPAVVLRKNKKGKTLQKKIAAAMAMLRNSASVVVMITSGTDMLRRQGPRPLPQAGTHVRGETTR